MHDDDHPVHAERRERSERRAHPERLAQPERSAVIDDLSPETEARLRAALTRTAADAPAPLTLDADDITRRARRRRTPRLVAVGAASCLAVIGLGTVAVQSLFPVLQPTLSASQSADESITDSQESAPMGPDASGVPSGETSQPLESTLVCGAPMPAPIASDRLSLAVDFAGEATTGGTISGEVVLTNSSDAVVHATSPVLATMVLADRGAIAWHTHGVIAQVVTELELQPGQSYRYQATVEPVRCTSEAQLERGETSELEPGRHELVAAIDLVLDDGTGIRLISEPVSITLR